MPAMGEEVPDQPGQGTPAGGALGLVLGEIDEIAEATLSSITISTMLKIVDRQEGQGETGDAAAVVPPA